MKNVQDNPYIWHPDRPYPLDITSFKETKEKLREAITDAVRDTQSAVIHSYPDRLVMTNKQYRQLAKMNDMFSSGEQEMFFWKTPYNVMEVEISD